MKDAAGIFGMAGRNIQCGSGHAVSFRVVHVIPGRMRFKIDRVKDDLFFTEALKCLLRSQVGVIDVRVNPACGALVLCFDPVVFNPVEFLRNVTEDALLLAEIPLEDKALKRLKKNTIYKTVQDLDAVMVPSMQATLGVVAFCCAVGGVPALVSRVVLGAAIVPMVNRAVRILFDEKRLAPDALDALSCLVLAGRRQFVPAGCIVLLVGLGEYIRDLAAKRFEKISSSLKALSGRSAWLVEDKKRTRIPVEELPAGAVIVVYTGEKVPVEGTVCDGSGVVAGARWQRAIAVGAMVEADSVLLEGKLYIRTDPASARSTTDAVEVRKRRRGLYRTSFQMLSLARAYRMFNGLLTWAAVGFLLNRNVGHALTLICFDLVTGIRIAVPAVVLESMHKAGQKGILIKNGAALERLSEVDTIVLANSGTITLGFADVTEVISLSDYSCHDVIRYAAAAEHRYYHPVARAIWRYARRHQLSVPERTGSLMIGGLGVLADVEGKSIAVGNKLFMQIESIDTSAAESPEFYVQSRKDSLAYVSIGGQLAGLVAYKDPVRTNVKQVVDQLHSLGVEQIVMTSGDSIHATRRVAEEAGIQRFIAELSPQEKADLVRDYQLKGRKVAMVGDDIGDELALLQADVAVSMRDSAEVARFESHVVLMDDDLKQLPESISIAKRAMSLAADNAMLVSIPNIAGLLLSVLNKIGPVHGALLNNGSVIAISLLGLLRSSKTVDGLEV